MLRLQWVIATLILISISQAAYAALAQMGPVNPQNGFPLWYKDTNGVVLQIGLDGDGINGLSIYDEVIPDNPWSVQTGFGDEAFYWSADATIALPGDRDADITLALECAYFQGPPLNGDQFVFGRVRIRIDTPVAGNYIVTHPYGVQVFTDVPAGTRGINYTADFGSYPGFAGAMNSAIGPFLVAVNPAPPPGYVGDPQINQTVTGSPFGTNFFRIEGPTGSNLGGPGINVIETDQFAVSGKIYPGPFLTDISVDRATYKRATSGQVDVFATSMPGATAKFSAGTVISDTAMTGDVNGHFYGHFYLSDASSLPDKVAVTAENLPNYIANTVEADLVDFVTITKAEYNLSTATLTIEASSGDLASPPTLVAQGYGTLTNGMLIVNNVQAPPASVTVESSAGGSATREVDVIAVPLLTTAIGSLAEAEEGSYIALASSVATVPTNKLLFDSQSDKSAVYVEDEGRAAGVRVVIPAGLSQVSEGDRIAVQGRFETIGGEKTIRAVNVTKLNSAEPLKALGMPVKHVQGEGLSNAGILIKTWGKVKHVAPDNSYFTIDEGSGKTDGNGNPGIPVVVSKIIGGVGTLPAVDIFATVTGIAGSEDLGGGIVPVIRPRGPDDIN